MLIDHWSTKGCLKDSAFDMPVLINFKVIQLCHFDIVVRDMAQTKLLEVIYLLEGVRWLRG